MVREPEEGVGGVGDGKATVRVGEEGGGFGVGCAGGEEKVEEGVEACWCHDVGVDNEDG